MSDVQTWNVAAASNNSAAPNGFPEGMPPSGVNDAAREVMAAVARYRSDTDGVNTSSGTNTITLAASRTMTAYAQGDLYTFKAGGTNTGATTLNVDSLGAKDVQFNGAALTGGEIVSGLMYTVVYDGTQFQLLNASSFPAIDITTLEVTNIKAKDGTAAATIANSTGKITVSSELAVDNINISGNTISSTDTNGNITLTPNGTGVVTTTTFDATNLEVTNIKAKDGTASATIDNSTGKVKFAGAVEIDTSTGVGGVPLSITHAADFSNSISVLHGGSDSAVVITSSYSGIVSPQQAALRITSTGTHDALQVEDSTNPDSTPFVIDASGKVVIGNTSALSSKIFAAETTIGTQVHSAVIQNSSIGLFNYSSVSGNPSCVVFNRSVSGTIGTLTGLANGDSIGQLQFNGADNNASSTYNPAAYIRAVCAGTVGTNSIPGRLTFWTTAESETTPTQRMSIEPTGYVGIGASATSAGQLLDLRGTNNGLTSDTAVNTLRFTDTDTTTAANQPIGKIEFYNSDTDNAAVGAYILSSAVGTAGGGTIRFGAAANAGAVAEIARVASTGLTVTASSAGLGYGTGSGGAVTQATSRTTGVTIDKTNGSITLVSAAGSTTIQSFTVTNNTVAATDTIIVNQKSGTDLYRIYVTAVADGSFRISFATLSGTTTEQPVFNFAVIKAVTA